jgi:hypothetical protein
MKPKLLFAFLLLSSFSYGQIKSTTYTGNGNSGFGGAIGQGSLVISDKGDSVSFTLRRGPGLLDSIVVFYVDFSSFVGIDSTSELTPQSDIYSQAVAGHSADGTKNAPLGFKKLADFRPDAAVVFNKDGGKVYTFGYPLFPFQDAGPLNVTPTGTNSSPTYTQTVSKTELGVSGDVTFKFVGTYIGNNLSRSNEGFGTSFAGFSRIGDNTTYRSYNPYSVDSYFTFSTVTATLPVVLTDLKANKEKDYVNVNWSVAQETNIDKYELQRSGNGIQYATIATVNAKNSSVATSYSYKDYSANAGNNYYRILISEKGKTEFSKVVYLNLNGIKSNFGASFVSGNVLNVTLNGMGADNYKLFLLNGSGQLVQMEAFQHNGTDQNRLINLNSNLSKGVYRVVLESGKEKFVTSVLVQ